VPARETCRSSLSPSPTILLSSSPVMSHNHPTSTSSNFQLILDNTLKAYEMRTKNDLLKHPLADRLQACNSPNSILAILQEQVQELNRSQLSNTKWLDPTVNVLHTFSDALGEGIGSVCFKNKPVRNLHPHICLKVFSPAKVIFIGFSVLLSVRTLNALVRFFVMQTILRRLWPFARVKTLFLRYLSA
jgi:hypothetical protein